MAKEQAKDPAGTAADMMTGAAERMQAAGKDMADQGAQLGLKMLDQAEQNTQAAFEAMRSAAKAGDLSDVMRIQADFMREQGSRSVTQAREIGEMIANFGRSAIGQMTGRG